MGNQQISPGRALLVGIPGPDLDVETRDRLVALDPAGVILFGRNLDSPARARALIEDLRRVIRTPCLIGIDQEGGTVSRLAPWIGATPTASDLGRFSPDWTERLGFATAGLLRSLGINLDFAPVVDLGAPGDASNAIGTRAFGTDPLEVSARAGAFLKGLQGGGVAGCLKHFPGLGATTVDSHVELPTDPRPLEALERSDLIPFRQLSAVAAAVMVGHARYPGIEPDGAMPATLSRRIVSDLLRGDLGFNNLVVTDDLEMGAVADRDVDGAVAVASVDAGCDLLLYCARLERAESAARALADSAQRDSRMAVRLEDACLRVETAATRWSRDAAPPTWDAALRELRPLNDLLA